MHYDIPHFFYQIGWRSRGHHAGQHTSVQRGMGMEFRGHTTLLSYPDPRRIDIRLTIRDPMEQVWVRVFNQKSATPLFAAVDISGSMNFGLRQSKISQAAEIVQSIAVSAAHGDDPFGVVAFDSIVREDWSTRMSYRPQQALHLAGELSTYRAPRIGNQGITEVYRYLPRERSLVFLISDFHLPQEVLESALSRLLRHHIVPIVLWNRAEYAQLPEFGITAITDFETGQQRTLLLRKSLREKIQAAFQAKREAITATFMQFDMPPVFIEDGYQADRLSDYFHQFMAAR